MTNYSLKSYLQIFFYENNNNNELAGKRLLKGEDRSIVFGQPYKKIDHPAW